MVNEWKATPCVKGHVEQMRGGAALSLANCHAKRQQQQQQQCWIDQNRNSGTRRIAALHVKGHGSENPRPLNWFKRKRRKKPRVMMFDQRWQLLCIKELMEVFDGCLSVSLMSNAVKNVVLLQEISSGLPLLPLLPLFTSFISSLSVSYRLLLTLLTCIHRRQKERHMSLQTRSKVNYNPSADNGADLFGFVRGQRSISSHALVVLRYVRRLTSWLIGIPGWRSKVD